MATGNRRRVSTEFADAFQYISVAAAVKVKAFSTKPVHLSLQPATTCLVARIRAAAVRSDLPAHHAGRTTRVGATSVSSCKWRVKLCVTVN